MPHSSLVSEPAPAVQPAAVAQKRILLVEDEPIIAMTETAVLRHEGYEVVLAKSGEAAIEAVTGDPVFDLILMDIDLGAGIDGTEAAQQILSQHDIPLVFLSSHTEPEVVAKTEGITSYGYIVKNSGTTVLLAAMRMAFRLYDAHRELSRANRRLEAANEELKASAETVQRSADQLRWWDHIVQYVVKHDPSAIAILDSELNFLYVSDRFVADFGVDSAELIGRHHYDVWPGLPEHIRDAHSRALRGETVHNDEDRLPRADGRHDDCQWLCMPWHDQSGAVGGIIIYIQLTTAQRTAERELRATSILHQGASRYLRAILDTTVDGFWIIDAAGRVADANAAYCRMSGYSEAEILGLHINDIDAIEDPAETAAHVQQIMTGGSDLFRTKHRRKDGSIFDVEVSVTRFEDAGEAKLICFCRDVSEQVQRETTLRSQNTELEAFFAINLDLLCIADTNGRFLKVNKEWERVLGFSLAELNGQSFLDFVHPDDLTATHRALGILSAQHEVINFVNRYRTADGSYRYIEWRSAPRGNLIYAAARDITAHKEAQTRAEERGALLGKLADQVPGFLYQYRFFPDGRGCFPFASEKIREIYEVRPHEVREDAATVMSRLHPEDYDAVVKSIQDSARTLEVWDEQYRVVLPERGVRYLRGMAQPEALDDGSVLWHGYITDITDRVRIAEQLRESERRWQFALDGADEGVWDWDAVHNTVFFSNRWKSMLGYAPDEVGDTLAEWESRIHPEDKESTFAALKRYFDGQTDLYVSEHRLRCKDGTYKWILDRGRTVSHLPDGSPQRVIGTHTDISAQKAYEQQILRLMREKDLLLRESLHRVKNNFAAVEGLLALKAQTTRNAEAQSMLKEAVSTITTSRILYEKLLHADGHGRVGAQVFLQDLAQHVLRALDDSSRIQLQLNVEPLWLASEQVFPVGAIVTELITNVAKHAYPAPRRGGIVWLDFRQVGATAVLTMTDHGPGFRGDLDPNDDSHFGLSVVRMLSQQLGGTVDYAPATPAIPPGTAVKVSFPLGNQEDETHTNHNADRKE